MKTRTKTGTPKLLISLACLALALVALTMLLTLPASADGSPIGDVIINYPYNTTEPPTGAGDTIWDGKDHPGYDQAYMPQTSAQHNGTATEEHVVVKDDSISFFGYQTHGYMDYVFSENIYKASYGNSFVMRPITMNFHSFSETGYLFNGTISASGYYTGYAIILQCANLSGMQENDANAPNTAALRLYYINNELFDADSFTPGDTSSTRTLIATFKTGINNLDSTPFRVNVEIDPATHEFDVYIDGDHRASVHSDIKSTNDGFGFYTGHYAHNCEILTYIKYENVTVNVDLHTESTTAEVKFYIDGSSTEIRTAETATGRISQRYRIAQPSKITFNGTNYYLVRNNKGKSVLTDFTGYYYSDPSMNAIELYYMDISLLTEPLAPEKTARVDGGEWDSGDSGDPVAVNAGSEVEYSITAYTPPEGKAVLNSYTTAPPADASDWFSQTNKPTNFTITAAKTAIYSIDVVDLSENYFVLDEFLDTLQDSNDSKHYWEGKEIVSAWDATEMRAYNVYRLTNRVYVWLTLHNNTVNQYDLYIGGCGGVWTPNTGSDLFNGYSNLQIAELKDLHISKTTKSLQRMFYGCTKLLALDLSSFDTSNVAEMHEMFIRCNSLESINLSSFDTSNVTNMTSMFRYCYALESLDLRNFRTANVSNMSYMFEECNSLTYLDLSSFDTSKVTTIVNMFANCKALTNLDLSNFNTSSVTRMSQMFTGCSKLETVNVSSFNTTAADNLSSMFSGCSVLKTLDLSSFSQTNSATLVSMFSGCTSLETLYLNNAVLIAGMSYTNTFQNCLSSLIVYVKDATAKAWVETAGSQLNTSNIIVDDGSVTPPYGQTNWEANINTSVPVPVFPQEGTAAYCSVTDVVPAGMTIVSGSISDGGALGSDGRTITWEVPVTSLPVSLSFNATVNPGADGTVFTNTAYVAYEAKSATSNTTYHEMDSNTAYITEQFLIKGTTTKLDEDQVSKVDKNDSYTVSTSKLGTLNGYQYCGYEIDGGGYQTGDPPASIIIDSSKMIKLYYEAAGNYPMVTVHFVKSNGDELKAPVSETVYTNSNWYMPQKHMNTITIGSTQWTYASQYQIGEPAPSGAKESGTPIKKDSVGLEQPVFSNIASDKHITLYFSGDSAIIVHFAEYGNPANILKNPKTYIGASTLDNSDFADISLESENGKIYTYVGYSIDGGAIVMGAEPPAQSVSATITLFFETTYAVTEYYVMYDGLAAVEIRVPKVNDGYKKGGTFAGTHADIKGFIYEGYCLENANNPMVAGDPASIGITDDVTVIYVYKLDPDYFTVIYDANGGMDPPIDEDMPYMAGENVTVLGKGSMTHDGYTFKSWNTKPDGTGATYQPGATLPMPGENVVLYAIWEIETTGSGGGGPIIPPEPPEEPEPPVTPDPELPDDPEDLPEILEPTTYADDVIPVPQPGPAPEQPAYSAMPQIPQERQEKLVDNGDGSFTEFNEIGVALGEWRWNDDSGEWVFTEFAAPLADLPKTGLIIIPLMLLLACGIVLTMSGFVVRIKKSRMEK